MHAHMSTGSYMQKQVCMHVYCRHVKTREKEKMDSAGVQTTDKNTVSMQSTAQSNTFVQWSTLTGSHLMPPVPEAVTHQPDVVAGEVEVDECGVDGEHLGQECGCGLRQLIASEVQRGEALVGLQGVGNCLATLVLDAVEVEVEGDKVGVVCQGMSQRLGTRRPHLVIGEVEHSQATVAQQLGRCSRATVSNEVVGQVQLLKGRVVQQAPD